MYSIIDNKKIAGDTYELIVEAPQIAQKSSAGQFAVVRKQEQSERIALTIADVDQEAGLITLVVLNAGFSTSEICALKKGEYFKDVAGPMGKPTKISKIGTVIGIGGGVGIAALFPVIKAYKHAGNRVISIIGAKSKNYLFWEQKVQMASDKVIVTTDDGSCGKKGFVTDALKEIIAEKKPTEVFAVGPAIMMKAVSDVTKVGNIKTVVSLNPIMVDGSGMCGACRVSVGGETYFACVDGPDFDAHKVDFDLLLKRQRMYINKEGQINER